MAPLTIVAHIEARADKTDLVKTELEKLIAVTRSEPGCLQYDLHRDNDNPALFMFYETWENWDLWQTHMNAPHLAAYGAATAGCVQSFTLHEMTAIG